VLLSQVHRLRALELLGGFLDLGPWAVSLALSVGIFPYVLKLLQSQAKELRPLLVFIWAKILAVDGVSDVDNVELKTKLEVNQCRPKNVKMPKFYFNLVSGYLIV